MKMLNNFFQWFIPLFLATFLSLFGSTECGISSKWDKCGCSWGDWEAWGTCNNECMGYHSRTRGVRMYTHKEGCPFKFSTCTTMDLASETSACNVFCPNGGTPDGEYCKCKTGFYGFCCRLQVNCGHPGLISNGELNGGTFTYDSTVRYTCHSGYKLMGGSSSRKCKLYRRWSGSKPRCAYFESCVSGPCKNGAVCRNIADDYRCKCNNGWSGKNCDIDIQPPVMTNCSSNKYITTSSLENQVKWHIPSFTDPHNFAIKITANYPSNEFTFPWGDFNVSYTAIKPTNGFSTNCLFSISLRPNPCPPINVPVNGALLCNNWRTDYGQFCKFFCKESYTVPRGVMMDHFYVCGASGTWMPSKTLPNCSVTATNLHAIGGYSIGPTYSNCTDDRREMQESYIDKLSQSHFRHFCKKFQQECIPENVSVKC